MKNVPVTFHMIFEWLSAIYHRSIEIRKRHHIDRDKQVLPALFTRRVQKLSIAWYRQWKKIHKFLSNFFPMPSVCFYQFSDTLHTYIGSLYVNAWLYCVAVSVEWKNIAWYAVVRNRTHIFGCTQSNCVIYILLSPNSLR